MTHSKSIIHLLTTSDDNAASITPIVSPVSLPLTVVSFRGTEGLSLHNECRIHEVTLTWQQLADHFECESNSTELSEHMKHQRDVSEKDARVKAMIAYVKERPDTLFPSLTIFVNQAKVINRQNILNDIHLETIQIDADASRLICDGQGRTTAIKALLREYPDMGTRTISTKLIVTETKDLYEASAIIRQAFADLNGQTKKPDTSLSSYFDESKAFSRLVKDVVECQLNIEGIDAPILMRKLISLNGTIKAGQLYTLNQFSQSLCALLGTTKSKLNEALKDEDSYQSTKYLAVTFFTKAFAALPLKQLWHTAPETYTAHHKSMMFTRDLFLKGLSHLGRSMLEESMVSEDGKVNWAALDVLKTLPLTTLDDPLWLNNQIAWKDDSMKVKSVKIYKASDKKIGRVLCQKCRVFPTLDI